MVFHLSGNEEDDGESIAAINTTPLVDVMLVLLIIFLITIPVTVPTVPLVLPKASNVPTQARPENVVIAVRRDGALFWNQLMLTDELALSRHLAEVADRHPQPEIHVRGDEALDYQRVARVIRACRDAGITRVGFITEPGAE